MELLITLLYILFVLSALVLVVVVLLQEGKGGGLGDALGTAGQQTFGVKASGIQRFTAIVAIVFVLSAVAIHILYKRRASGTLGGSLAVESVEQSRPLF
jgi:preprotein translocase subunit SecG